MLRTLPALVSLITLGLFAADEQAWKGKPIAEWTEDDARLVLSDSPWVKTVTPSVTRRSDNGQSGYGRRNVGFGIPGIGGRRGGYGYPGGGGNPGGSRTGGTDSNSNQAPPMLKLRWESALPVREAELKTRDTAAPTLDENHYAIAVYGVPSRFVNGDPKKLADQYKDHAVIKREGKKDLKPSSVEVLQREDGPVVVYLFPRSKEITKDDRRLELDAKIGAMEVDESFFPEDMVFQNKLEL